MSISEEKIRKLLRVSGDFLYHRESQVLEFKEQYNYAGLAEYFKDFAAFSNNIGGYIIFGIKDSPRIPIGLNKNSLDQFFQIDPERITGFLLEIFSSDINWEQAVIEINKKYFGVFRIFEANMKPIIARKNEGKDQTIKNGEVYFRYGGRTQRIKFSELQTIIRQRETQLNEQWMSLMSTIGRIGPQSAAIIDTESGSIEKDGQRIMMLDEKLAKGIKFIRQGEFTDTEGAEALKLIGEIVPVSKVEIIKTIKENLLKQYPLSAMQLASEVKKRTPKINQNEVWRIIQDLDIKNKPLYSVYNFRNKNQEDLFNEMDELPSSIPSLYNQQAVDLIVDHFKSTNQ
jgi:hypothetical protein